MTFSLISQSKRAVKNVSHYQLEKYHLIPARNDLPASGQFSSPQHKQNKQDLMDDFPNPAGENIANVLPFEDPFLQISSQDYKNISAEFNDIQRLYLSPELRSTSVLKRRLNKSTENSLARPLYRSTSKILIFKDYYYFFIIY